MRQPRAGAALAAANTCARPMSSFFTSHHMPCPRCGASVAEIDRDDHECDPRRQVDFRMLQLRDEVASFDESLDTYLASPRGRFALWLAARERERRQRRG
jgi:hypothetical protein